VPVRRVADVVGQPGQVHQIRIAAQPDGHPAADLGDLQRVRQPGAGGVTVPGPTTWVLSASRRSAAQCSTRARSRANAVRARSPSRSARCHPAQHLRRLRHQPLPVEVVVVGCVVLRCHRRTVCQHRPELRT
jgi:hypothetical protein